MKLPVDEQLGQALETIISQFPPLVQDSIDLTDNQAARDWRLMIFEAFSRLRPQELTIDQITAAQLPELLALATKLNPPFFQPTNITPATLAAQKATSYVSAYLMSQFTRRLRMVGNTPQLVEELTTNAGDVMLAQIQRLQFNYNRRYRLVNYLADVKARVGLIAAMTAKQSAALTGVSSDVINLAGQIGQALGINFYIKNEHQQLTESQNYFNQLLTAGHYPLALLFAQEKSPEWFTDFFSEKHRPTPAQFERAYQLTMAHTADVNEISNDLNAQLRLDIQVLPSGSTQDQLLHLVEKLAS